SREIWNGAIEHQPLLFAQCETTQDVQVAVQTARRHGLPLSVKGGGHDWAGRSLCPDGLEIHLSRMRSGEVDASAGVAKVYGGASSGEVVAATAPSDLVAGTGALGVVGMVGLSLGGGYGPLTSRYGLALDNMVSADVVLPDGTLVTADSGHHADLFW